MTAATITTAADVARIMASHRNETTGTTPVQHDDVPGFWNRREVLAHILEFARARRAGPWAVLAVVLARAVASVEPNVMLPPIIGGPVSLNLFAALVGPSGGGKGAAEGAARNAVRFADHTGTDNDAETFTLGSGEGLARTYRPNGNGSDATNEDRSQWRSRALFTVAEVDTLAALGSRTGATLLPELRKLYSGETIGFQNASKVTRCVIPAHEYRACLIVGVQPAKAAPLIHDADGGTPQRFVWLPVDDPDAPDTAPTEPPTLDVKAPKWGSEPVHLEVPDVARNSIDAHRLAVLRGEPVDPLDGHRMLSRLKVAAALSILDGRSIVNAEDWDLAGVIMAKSDRTRAGIEHTLTEHTRRSNRARAEMDGERAVIVDDVKAAGEYARVRKQVLARLGRRPEGVPRGELGRAIKAELRVHVDDVLDDLVSEGVATTQPMPRSVLYILSS
ncbi:hypothetical protein I0Q12_19575 [Rhodococcus sp. CX]|uniref:hypothetical protein n=1 Tax=Rhodococcus sp. CX TaxID=2789880 RepID=UPI0018CD5402|nr:hypothetical protein [Rhodococcus sp. CX]MBH0121592.1 hypothetical protein [Rhodococcus sp. CX]